MSIEGEATEAKRTFLDPPLPPEIARRAEEAGVRKAGLDGPTTFALAVLAGAFIGLGAAFSTTVTAGSTAPFGMTRLAGGVSFCLGLILVVVTGAELFTGNALIVMAAASGKVSPGRLARNWAIVYAGNFAGAAATAAIVLAGLQHAQGGGSVGLNALGIAAAKCDLGFGQAVALGAMCNALVCLAVWLSLGARSMTDKILAVLFPVSAFVALGFEHSVANMYLVPLGLGIKSWGSAEFWSLANRAAADFPGLTWGRFLVNNLLPVTLGNIFGGAGMVGLVYWFIYLRPPAGNGPGRS